MRAFVIDAASRGTVRDVPETAPEPDEVVVDVQVVGLCGTDVDLFTGNMPYLEQDLARYPLRPGHEWSGTVREVGAHVSDFASGDRVTGDTFIGCGHCDYCRTDRHHLCPEHVELGVRGGRAGALADRLAIPAVALHRLPDAGDASAGALVEPGSCSLRGVKAAGVRQGSSVAIYGAGTLGLLAAHFCLIRGARPTIVAETDAQIRFVQTLGFSDVVREAGLASREFDAVLDATGADEVPEQALRHTAPGGRLVLLGVPVGSIGLPVSRIVHNDITVVGVLGGSAEIDETIDVYASGQIDLSSLIAATVGLDEVARLLESGLRRPGTAAPKFQVSLSN